jgi:FK506-binding protein 4/5
MFHSGEAGGAITLDITLVGIITIEKIESDGSVSKKTLKEGSGWNRPNEGAKVGVRLTGYLPDGTKFEETPEGELTRWVTDEEQVGLLTMPSVRHKQRLIT